MPAPIIEIHGITERIVVETWRSRLGAVHFTGLSSDFTEEKPPARGAVVRFISHYSIISPMGMSGFDFTTATEEFPAILPPGEVAVVRIIIFGYRGRVEEAIFEGRGKEIRVTETMVGAEATARRGEEGALAMETSRIRG